MRIIPKGHQWWPKDIETQAPERIIQLYEDGYCGAYSDPDADESLMKFVTSSGGMARASDVTSAYGLAGAGAGKLSLPFLAAEKVFGPQCMPGPAQTRGDCVSHGTKNACLITAACEILDGRADEATGQIEGPPEQPAEGVSQGVFSTEAIYWWRDHGGDGWSCGHAAEVVLRESGLWVRKDYPEFGFDLTRYSGQTAGKWGSKNPPADIKEFGVKHAVRTCTVARAMEEVRDLLASGYGVSHCGSEGWASKRDENGFSNRSGSWAHAMAYIGYDDRDIIKQKYGEPLVLILNSWGTNWISGGRRILGTNIDIPHGSYWAKASACKGRTAHAFSGVNGWPRRRLTGLGWEVAA